MKTKERETRKAIVKAIAGIITIETATDDALKGKYLEIPEFEEFYIIRLMPMVLNTSFAYELEDYRDTIRRYAPFLDRRYSFMLVKDPGESNDVTYVAIVLEDEND
jgi:hypothetical protein